MEESSFKLTYPLFLSYGPDSARITPFFPGTSTRPVAVNLAPNHDGYSLHAEGADCGFPVDYTLTAADGALLASGTYVGGVSHLTGTKTGSMVLSFRMATVATNNYGCNIVVSARAGTS